MAIIVFGFMFSLKNWAVKSGYQPVEVEWPVWKINKYCYTNTQYGLCLKIPGDDWQFEIKPENMIAGENFPGVFWRILYQPVVEMQVLQQEGIRAVLTIGAFPNRIISNSLQLEESILLQFQNAFSADSTFRILKMPTRT